MPESMTVVDWLDRLSQLLLEENPVVVSRFYVHGSLHLPRREQG